MLCGPTRIVSRIKHMIFFSFSKKYRPFEHLKCHECLWCKFFDDCKQEHERMLRYDAKTKQVSMNPDDYIDWNAAFDYMNKHL